ncbi:hypothetical protein D1631_18625 [Chryseobacterium nematophagum]|uniref:Uncharacterized protein n=1 Tax=Chryseobacterium nematophagum TaxID=2305228 RepID=A0A3M7TC27_9FLAO|nr:hypothetical protein [Chryseobacterium nematophagum]RNA60504.1 hypothetical protein D1631_18625 [Chryseobacterium nematophagum]
MKADLFKNFKTLKEKKEENKSEDLKVDSVSVDVKEENVRRKDKDNKISQSNSLISSQSKKNENLKEQFEEAAETIKKRPIKKEILEARAALSQEGSTTGVYSKRLNLEQGKRTFTVFLKSDSLEFLKDLIFYKATAERQIFYNQSEAIVEGLELIMPLYKNIVSRPNFIREQEKNKKGGRKRNSDEIYDSTTTAYIPGQYYDFIKDVTYNKVVGGDLYFKDWDLLESSISKLKKKYGNNIQPRPDYIREEEKQRGRKSTTKS